MKLYDENIIKFIKELSEKKNIRKNLEILKDHFDFAEDQDDVYEFYLLYYSMTDLDDLNMDLHWAKGLTRDNYPKVIQKIAKEWLVNKNIA